MCISSTQGHVTRKQNVNFVKISVSEPSALGLRCLKRSHPFFPVAPRRPLRPLVSPRPGVQMLSSRRWRVSRQASPFLSLPLPSTCARIQHFYPSPGALDTVSFGLDDILLTAASDSEDFGPALADALPPCGQEARPSAAYSELVDVLSRATEKLSLDWPDEPRESQASKLDERFLGGPNSRPERRKLPFFSDLHQEISRSWKQPFSSHLTNAAAADFTNLVGSVDQGYTAIPVVEDTLASHLSPSLAPSWKSRPLLPTKPCTTTSALIGKSYIAAGQAGMALHTMAILQAYQADVLKEMDEGTGLTPEAVKELLRATDLALGATKHTGRAVGRSMAGSVAAEHHLWLNLTEILEKEKVFLLDAPISQSGLFGEAVSSVVEKFRSAKTQSAALKQFMLRRTRDHSTPSSSLSREQSLPRKEPSGRSVAQAAHPPPTRVWGARGQPFPHQRPRRRVDLKWPSRPAASYALPGTGIGAVCGSLQSWEKILPIAGVFWCWPPRACHVKAEDFSLGERRYFAGLWGAEPSFTS